MKTTSNMPERLSKNPSQNARNLYTKMHTIYKQTTGDKIEALINNINPYHSVTLIQKRTWNTDREQLQLTQIINLSCSEITDKFRLHKPINNRQRAAAIDSNQKSLRNLPEQNLFFIIIHPQPQHYQIQNCTQIQSKINCNLTHLNKTGITIAIQIQPKIN